MVTTQEFKQPYYNLKIIIDKKRLTQTKVAEKIGMDRATFNLKLNRTKGRDFSLEEAKAIADVVEERIDDFF
ncbi:TPA: helix-turn-helix transcriptional regulator [Enterococcus faecalis]